ncbi:RIP metalloprotease RseP [Flavobacterium filum]|uniref:RIP metalloprotease RseP n=1 Tax=Flavobacterium filum TaxID=370974 RepID=UPI0023F0AEB9|nr:RIP metalloprotease RseP [Flavobacterium filum]
METLIQIAQLILCLSFLVILHELGHFLPAKFFKTKIEKFYLFFNPWFSLVKKKIGETEYGIGWLPMGGYVKIAGMIDESMDKEQLKQEPQPWEYRSKPAWQRLIIIMGGVIVNFFIAWIIYTSLFVNHGDNYVDNSKIKYGISVDSVGTILGLKNGDKILKVDGKAQTKFEQLPLEILFGDNITVERDGKEETFDLSDEGKRDVIKRAGKNFLAAREEVVVDTVIPGLSAEKAGLVKNDQIIAVNGNSTRFFDEFTAAIQVIKNDTVSLTVKRNNEELLIKAKTNEEGKLGFGNQFSVTKNAFITKEMGIAEAIPAGLNRTFSTLTGQIKQFKIIFNTKTEAYKQVSGPLRMFKIFKPEWDWTFFWSFTAMFSIWLAFLNVLPIPGLDGGHAVFILIEMITRKKPTEKTLEVAQTIGVVILLTLMALVFGNDIWHLVTGS